MTRPIKSLVWTLLALAMVFQVNLGANNVAHARKNHIAGNDLAYNYYVGPGVCADGRVAGMYPSPRPTPPMVGHTHITYQPLMPHEFLYRHQRTYWSHHPGAGWSQTKVKYRTGLWPNIWPVRTPARPRPVGAVHNLGWAR